MTDEGETTLPETMLAWPLYGAGLENLGEEGRPVRWPLPKPGDDQLLVRSDAVGLCYSDVKIIRLGPQHPRLLGRDMRQNPVVQGHEVALTVVAVGEELKNRFWPGQRFAMQADIYVNGRNLAFGYYYHGGLEQFALLGPEILSGDEGCYAISTPPELGYAEVALTEPWACVEAAYAIRRRLSIKPGGVLWVVGRPGDRRTYRLGSLLTTGKPARVVLTDVPAGLRAAFVGALGETAVVIRDGVHGSAGTRAHAGGYRALAAEVGCPAGFDDVIVLDAGSAALLEAVEPAMAPGATINLTGVRPFDRPVTVDIGRVHYEALSYLGTQSEDLSQAYGRPRNRSELRAGGAAWAVGGGGPMGRMHIQRMIEMRGGPKSIVVTETNVGRETELNRTFAGAAAAHGIAWQVINPRDMTQAELDARLAGIHGGAGFDDIVVLAAKAETVAAAAIHLAPDGLLDVFAGLPRGTLAALDLSNVYLGNMQVTGTSGSRISDQAAVIEKVHTGQLSTASAVAAIGGLDAAADGIRALMEGRFAGKVVIFPPVASFPLTPLADLAKVAPSVHALLAPGPRWTREAEREFLRLYT
jgi:threonine dehydrogenase-like Zn-dependent dehydrogenase